MTEIQWFGLILGIVAVAVLIADFVFPAGGRRG